MHRFETHVQLTIMRSFARVRAGLQLPHQTGETCRATAPLSLELSTIPRLGTLTELLEDASHPVTRTVTDSPLASVKDVAVAP